MKTYTVFCQDSSRTGTTWIDTVTADNVVEASNVGQSKCAADWGCDESEVVVIGIAKGDVEIVEWNDAD